MYFNSSLKLITHPSRERKNVNVSEVREDIVLGGRIILNGIFKKWDGGNGLD
jgi:exopolyphosphatase/pppGpp-phosphohydrolase